VPDWRKFDSMNPITDSSFQNLTKTEQVVMVMRLGRELLTRISDNHSIHLYLLSNIFVEVWYEKETDKIIKLNTIDKQDIIQNYGEMNNIIHYLFEEQKL
jgi:hypothetical protein